MRGRTPIASRFGETDRMKNTSHSGTHSPFPVQYPDVICFPAINPEGGPIMARQGILCPAGPCAAVPLGNPTYRMDVVWHITDQSLTNWKT